MISPSVFLTEVARRKAGVNAYLKKRQSIMRFRPPDIEEAALSYFALGGKSLRPAVLLFSCGAVGGREEKALPAAAAVEVYHTWTLVHDDIIDRDRRRRGGETVHERFRRLSASRYRLSTEEAFHYGLAVAILAGDIQQGWMVGLLSDLCGRKGLAPGLALALIRDLELGVHSALIEGELLDVQYALRPFSEVCEQDILHMVGMKTGALFGFAGRAGAMIGLETTDTRHSWVKAIASFCRDCGVAFQLQDDILGLVGDEKRLGKEVGSDLREGKKTILLAKAWEEASPRERRRIEGASGKKDLSSAEGKAVAELVVRLGGVTYTRALALGLVRSGLGRLAALPGSRHKDLLAAWANYLVQRTF
jgi:geranylgeranyl diphosphate synthase type I